MNFFKSLKRFHASKYEIYLLIIVLFALTLRLILIAFSWPTINSDEGTMGLVALHIAYKGELPIFFYGQFYMGTIEGYIAAILFHVFGSSLFVLRLSLLPFFALFLLCMYGLTSLLQTKNFALFTTLLFSFGAWGMLLLQLRAIGGYPETEAFAAAICLIVVWLALSLPSDNSIRRVDPVRLSVYTVLGLICGLAIWIDLLILPFVCMGILFLLLFCRREIFSFAGLGLLLGGIIGLFPMIIYNVQVPYDKSSIYELLVLQNGGSDVHYRFLAHLVGAFAIGLPTMLSYGPSCAQSSFPFFGQLDLPCVLPEIAWGMGYLILCVVVLSMALIVLWKLLRSQKGRSILSYTWSWEQRQTLIRECGRLMVLICALGTFLLYLKSTAAATDPGTAFRYLIGMLISVPTVLWPLWNGIRPRQAFATWKKTLSAIVRISLLLLVLCMSMYGTYHVFKDGLSGSQEVYQQQDTLAQRLTALHIKYVYSEYWTCDMLTFISNEKVICSVLSPNLQPGFNRYPAYQKMVAAATDPTYLFPEGSNLVPTFERDITQKKFKTTFQKTFIDGYVVYTPKITH